MIFSEPFESTDGTVVITVSRPGWGDRQARPIGIYAVTSQRTTFTPAVDASRVALIGALTGFAAAVIATLAVLRRPPWPELTEAVMIAVSKEKAALRKA
jgi:hypothetical protein